MVTKHVIRLRPHRPGEYTGYIHIGTDIDGRLHLELSDRSEPGYEDVYTADCVEAQRIRSVLDLVDQDCFYESEED